MLILHNQIFVLTLTIEYGIIVKNFKKAKDENIYDHRRRQRSGKVQPHRRFERRFDALVKILPYCDEVTFFDNDNGFVEVAEYKSDEIIFKGTYKPQWLTDLCSVL